MKYKLIVSDFDGTLCDAKKRVSTATIEAIRDYEARGGKFVVSSGRALGSIRPILEKMGFGGVVCSFNGGVVSEVVSRKILFEKTFSNERSVNLLKTLEREGLFFLFFEREVYYANGRNAWLKTYEMLTSTKAEVVTGEAPSEFAKKRNMRLYKALVAVEEDKRNQLIARLSSILGDDYYITSGGSVLAEICVKGCTKGTAIKFLSAHYGIPVEEILAVGDGMNDLEMLQTAGLGIAVKNGDDALKGKVRFYDYTNEEDAVRHIIEEFA